MQNKPDDKKNSIISNLDIFSSTMKEIEQKTKENIEKNEKRGKSKYHNLNPNVKLNRDSLINIPICISSYYYFPRNIITPASSGEDSDFSTEKESKTSVPSIRKAESLFIDQRILMLTKNFYCFPAEAEPGIFIVNIGDSMGEKDISRFLGRLPKIEEYNEEYGDRGDKYGKKDNWDDYDKYNKKIYKYDDKYEKDEKLMILNMKFFNVRGINCVYVKLKSIEQCKNIMDFFGHPIKLYFPSLNTNKEPIDVFYAYMKSDLTLSYWYGVIIRNLPLNISKESLTEYLEKYEKIKYCLDPIKYNDSSSCCLVVYDDLVSAENACLKLNGQDSTNCKRIIKVNFHSKCCKIRKNPNISIYSEMFNCDSGYKYTDTMLKCLELSQMAISAYDFIEKFEQHLKSHKSKNINNWRYFNNILNNNLFNNSSQNQKQNSPPLSSPSTNTPNTANTSCNTYSNTYNNILSNSLGINTLRNENLNIDYNGNKANNSITSSTIQNISNIKTEKNPSDPINANTNNSSSLSLKLSNLHITYPMDITKSQLFFFTYNLSKNQPNDDSSYEKVYESELEDYNTRIERRIKILEKIDKKEMEKKEKEKVNYKETKLENENNYNDISTKNDYKGENKYSSKSQIYSKDKRFNNEYFNNKYSNNYEGKRYYTKSRYEKDIKENNSDINNMKYNNNKETESYTNNNYSKNYRKNSNSSKEDKSYNYEKYNDFDKKEEKKYYSGRYNNRHNPKHRKYEKCSKYGREFNEKNVNRKRSRSRSACSNSSNSNYNDMSKMTNNSKSQKISENSYNSKDRKIKNKYSKNKNDDDDSNNNYYSFKKKHHIK